jgi:predicted RNase H-like HicB family nuclease
MKQSARYVKIVEWSEEDQCFVGSCPGLLYGGCHGDRELAVFEQLCIAVDEVIDLYKQDGKPLPQPTSGRDFANKMLSVAQGRPSLNRRPRFRSLPLRASALCRCGR